MKLVLAAPASGLPSELTALVAQLSAMHFFMNEVFAAPARGLPSLPTALVSQDSCAKADPNANAVITAARKIRFIMGSLLEPRRRSGLDLGIPAQSSSQAELRCQDGRYPGPLSAAAHVGIAPQYRHYEYTDIDIGSSSPIRPSKRSSS